MPAEDLRVLPTAEAALRLLLALRTSGDVNINSMLRGAEQGFAGAGERDVRLLLERLSDAWAWLVSRGLIGPAVDQDPHHWSRLTAAGSAVVSDLAALPRLRAEEALPLRLHTLLEQRVRPIFLLGDHETAAFAAMKEVEVRVRQLAGAPASLIGVPLMRQAFAPDKEAKGAGPLTDLTSERGEQQARMDLFAGALGSFKNPSSHRVVDYADPDEAAEVVLVADLLMRILDRVETQKAVRSSGMA